MPQTWGGGQLGATVALNSSSSSLYPFGNT